MREGSGDNTEGAIESMVKCWKKAIRKGAQNSPHIVKLIRHSIVKAKEEYKESQLLILLEFFLKPEDASNYSANALEALKNLPPEVKNKSYIMPILAYILSAGNADHKQISQQLVPILVHIAAHADLASRLKGLGLLLTMARIKILSCEEQQRVLNECKLLLKHYKRSVRIFARVCINEILCNS